MRKAILSLLATATVTIMYVIQKEDQLLKLEQLDYGEEME